MRLTRRFFDFLLVSSVGLVATAGDEPKEPRRDDRPTSHSDKKIEGWTVRVDDRLVPRLIPGVKKASW
jgi:hypothetical protein